MKTIVNVVCVNLLLCVMPAQLATAQPALDVLEKQLDRILSGRKTTTDDPDADASKSGFLGLTADESKTAGAVQIIGVDKAGPAEAAGLKTGDLVVAINRKSIRTLDDMAGVLASLTAGERVEFEVFRSGRRVVSNVTLGKRPVGDAPPDARPRAEPLPAPVPRVDERRPSLGIRVVDVTDDARARYGLSVRRGALVSAVTEGWPAHRAGLKAGDTIVSAGENRVDVANDLIEYVRLVRPDATVDLTFYRGDRLYKTGVRLAEIADAPLRLTPPTAPAVAEPRIFGEDRPALRRIEGVIGRLASPDRESRAEVTVLKHEVELLRQQVKILEQKVNDLEDRLRD